MSNLNEIKTADEQFIDAYDALLPHQEDRSSHLPLKLIALVVFALCIAHSLYAVWADSTGRKDVFRDKTTPFTIVKTPHELEEAEKCPNGNCKPFFDPSQAALTPARVFDNY